MNRTHFFLLFIFFWLSPLHSMKRHMDELGNEDSAKRQKEAGIAMEEKINQLLKAINNNDTATVDTLLQEAVPVNSVNVVCFDGDLTPLQRACFLGRREIVQKFLEKGLIESCPQTGIYYALIDGHLGLVNDLLFRGMFLPDEAQNHPSTLEEMCLANLAKLDSWDITLLPDDITGKIIHLYVHTVPIARQRDLIAAWNPGESAKHQRIFLEEHAKRHLAHVKHYLLSLFSVERMIVFRQLEVAWMIDIIFKVDSYTQLPLWMQHAILRNYADRLGINTALLMLPPLDKVHQEAIDFLHSFKK